VACATIAFRSLIFFYHYFPHKGTLQDTPTYEYPAQSLLSEGRFVEAPDIQDFFSRLYGETPSTRLQPMFVRTPGFPFLIAAVYGLGGGNRAFMFLQILISGVGVWFTYLLGKKLFSEGAGVIAAIAVAIDPLTTWVSQKILADTLFTVLLLGAVLLSIGLLRKPGWLLALGFGTVLALATLVKPVSYYLPVPACVLLWAGGVPKKLLIGLLAPVLLLVGGWQARNLATVGTTEFCGIAGTQLLLFRAAFIVASEEHIDLQSAQEKLVRALPPPSSMSSAELNRVYFRAAIPIIAAHPLSYSKDVVSAIFAIAISRGRSTFGLDAVPIVILYRLYLVLIYLLLAVEAVSLKASPERILHGLMALIVIYIFLVSAADVYPLERYRTPVMPFFAAYAGAGMVWVYRRWTMGRQPLPAGLRPPEEA
jgi:4-amino-4-deoxy-L-arabinose transferase-like glycosyltransferase